MLSRLHRILFLFVSLSLFALPLSSQTFSAPQNYGPFTDTFQMKAGDFNRDGGSDFVGVTNFNHGTQTEVFVYMNHGDGTFPAPRAVAGTVGAGAVDIGDFNQDGNLDFAFTTATQVGVCYGDGHGNFTSPTFFNVNGAPNSIAVGDFNSDGKPDIATLSDANKRVTVLTRTASTFTPSSFSVPIYYSTHNSGYPPDHVGNLVAGDFNGNHRIDLAYLDFCADESCGPGLSRIYTLDNTANGFQAQLLVDQVSGSNQMYAADLDLDGKVDLLVTEILNGFATILVEYSNGNDAFQPVSITSDTQNNIGIPEDLVVGDFNNDAIEDIAALTQVDMFGNGYPGFDVYTGKGGRTGFNVAKHFADNTNVSPRGGFAAAFIDKNGTKDMALVDASGLAVFLNTTATSNDPCPYLAGTGLNNCLPVHGGGGISPVHVLDSYKAAAQPAQRIEFWVDGSKLFQEYGDLLDKSISLPIGRHLLSVVGVDATGKPIKSNTYYTVIAQCSAPTTPGVKICRPQNGSTISSPVIVSAAALASSGLHITAVRLYVDGTDKYTSTGATLYTSVPISAGQHHLVVVGYENNGDAFTAAAAVTVK